MRIPFDVLKRKLSKDTLAISLVSEWFCSDRRHKGGFAAAGASHLDCLNPCYFLGFGRNLQRYASQGRFRGGGDKPLGFWKS